MKGEVTRRAAGAPAKRLSPRNSMTFPRELRNAIPDLPTCVGRTLELASVHGFASNTRLFGARLHLDLRTRETGKLKGRFTVGMDLEPEAARGLAANLLELAERADKLPQSVIPPVNVRSRKRE